MKNIKLFILEDHKIVRDGMRLILESASDFQLIGECGHPKEFLDHHLNSNFDILLLDITLPEMNGIEVLKKIKLRRPELKVIMLSMHNNAEYIVRSFKDGANAYMPKDIESHELLRVIRMVAEEGQFISENHAKMLSEAETKYRQEQALSEREREILKLMIDGKSSKEMAKDLGISHRTIENHRLNIMRKLGTTNSSETVAKALKGQILL